MAELKAAGKVRLVGLSNVSVDQIKQARQVVEVASVQNEFSPRFRRSEGELAFCAAQRIAFLPWARSAGRPVPTWAAATPPSPRSPPPGVSPSRSPWPGSWPRPRWSSPSPGPPYHRQRRRRPTEVRLARRAAAASTGNLPAAAAMCGRVRRRRGRQEHQQEAGQEHRDLEQQGALEGLGEVLAAGGVGGGGTTRPIRPVPGPGPGPARLAGTAEGSLALARSSKQVRNPAATCWVAAGGGRRRGSARRPGARRRPRRRPGCPAGRRPLRSRPPRRPADLLDGGEHAEAAAAAPDAGQHDVDQRGDHAAEPGRRGAGPGAAARS